MSGEPKIRLAIDFECVLSDYYAMSNKVLKKRFL